MPSIQEYAVLAAEVYNDAKKAQNTIGLSGSGWTRLAGGYSDMADTPLSSGFFASAYQKGNNIVIAFKGTDFLIGTNNGQTGADGLADLGLGLGLGSSQLIHAAIYYEQVKALNPRANITFTKDAQGQVFDNKFSRLLTRQFYEGDRNGKAAKIGVRRGAVPRYGAGQRARGYLPFR